jgi:hypothetical protein
MRTKELKIGTEKKEGVLVAGGSGFKVYAVSGLEGWALALGRKISFIEDSNPAFQTVADYVNLKYQPVKAQETIKSEFAALVSALQSPAPRDSEPEL